MTSVDEHIGLDAVKLEPTKKTGIGVNGNLIPPVAGEVRNPRGRTPGSKNRATIAKEFAAMVIGGKNLKGQDDTNMTAEEKMIAALWAKAFGGDINAIKEIQDTLYGKVADKTELTGKDGGDIKTQATLPENDRAILEHYFKTKGEVK